MQLGNNVSSKPFLFFRIAVGLFCLLHFLSIAGDMHMLFGFDAIFPAEITGMYVDERMITNQKLLQWSGLSEGNFITLFNILYITGCIFVAAGIFTRVAVLMLALLHIALLKNNVFFTYGVDYFTSISLFYLLFFPTGKSNSSGSLVCVRLLQWHLCIAYVFSGLNKLIGYNWWNGEAVWKAINLPYSNIDFKFSFGWMADHPMLLVIMGWGVVILELCYPLILINRIRKYWLGAVITMHLGIALVINLYFFSAIMLIWNLAAFYNFGRIPWKIPAQLRDLPTGNPVLKR